MEKILAGTAGIFLLLYVVTLMLSPLWSVSWVVSLLGSAPRYQGVLFRVALVCIALFCAVIAQKPQGKRAIKQAILLSNIIVIAYGILQMMHADPFAWLWDSDAFLGRTFSTIGHPNALGQYIVLTVPFCFREIFLTQKHNQKVLWIAVVIMNGIVLSGTVSRSAILGMLCMVLIALPLFRDTIRSWTRIRRVWICMAAVLTIAFVGFFFMQRFSQSYIAHRSISAREVIWNAGWRMIAERPQGYGVETLSFTTPAFLHKDLYAYESLTTVVDRMHNQPLELLVTLGPLGLISYYGFFGTLVFLLWKKRKRNPSSWENAILSAIVGYTVALLFGFASIATAVFFWAIVGLGLGAVSPQQPRYRMHPGILLGVLCGASVILSVCAVQWIRADRYIAMAQQVSPKSQLAYLQESITTFRFDRQAIIHATQAHIAAYEKTKDPDILRDIAVMQDMHGKLTEEKDGVFFLLQSWNASVQGQREQSVASLQKAHKLLPNSITYYRSAIHIAQILDDTSLEERSKEALMNLLPEAYFDKDSQTRRLLQKQHPWLLTCCASSTML